MKEERKEKKGKNKKKGTKQEQTRNPKQTKNNERRSMLLKSSLKKQSRYGGGRYRSKRSTRKVEWSKRLETEPLDEQRPSKRKTTVVQMDVSEAMEKENTIHIRREGQMEAEVVRKNIVRLVLKGEGQSWLKILLSLKTRTVKQICTRKYQITLGKGGTHLKLKVEIGTVWWKDATGHFSPRVPYQSSPYGADLSWLEGNEVEGKCLVETIDKQP